MPVQLPEVEVSAQLPFTAKQPAVRLKPLFAVEVAPEVRRRLPLVMVRPFDEERPVVCTPANVDVPDPEAKN